MIEELYKESLAAFKAIYPPVQVSPVREVTSLKCSKSNVFLKNEAVQQTGSFKLRGAAYFLSRLSDRQRSQGLVAVSTGNHGKAVAWLASQEGIPCRVFVSKRVPENKLQGLRQAGAVVEISGDSQDEAFDRAHLEIQETGETMVPPFDHPRIISGQATIGLELIQQVPEVDVVYVPVSGGGLAAGVTVALKSVLSDVKVVGVCAQKSPVMAESIERGQIVEMEEQESLADSLLGGIGLDNKWSFPILRDLLDEMFVVSEESILEAMRFLYSEELLVMEGAACAAFAALMNSEDRKGIHVAILSGCNIDSDRFLELMSS